MTIQRPTLTPNQVKKLLIDEKSVRKGQCYVTVILNGETGTGKELVSRAIHPTTTNPNPQMRSTMDALRSTRLTSQVVNISAATPSAVQARKVRSMRTA